MERERESDRMRDVTRTTCDSSIKDKMIINVSADGFISLVDLFANFPSGRRRSDRGFEEEEEE